MPQTPHSTPTVELSFVTPRCLAGGGDPAWVTVPLHRACGWSHGHDPLLPRVLLTSPDQLAMLRLEPHPDKPWWTIRHAATAQHAAWSAWFDARVPVEIIAAFTDALALSRTEHLDGSPDDPYQPLRQAGWSADEQHGAMVVSPDTHARVEHLTDQDSDYWFASADMGMDAYEPEWRAYFGGTTPTRLITAFTAALADEAPLPRQRGQMPIGRYQQITTRSVPVDDIGFALERRVQQLARGTGRKPAPAARPVTPLQRPPTR